MPSNPGAPNPSFARLATDPLRNFKFRVHIHDGNKFFPVEMGFVSVSGLNVTTDVIPYRQGGHNTTTQKMPGQSDFGPITLNKGLILGDRGPVEWMNRLFSVIQGKGGGGAAHEFRFGMLIKVLAHPVTDKIVEQTRTHAIFQVYNAWPTSIGFSDLDAGANAIVVQSMTLAHEGWRFKVAKSPSDHVNVDSFAK